MNGTPRYGAIAFTAPVAERQKATGSIHRYGRRRAQGENVGGPDELDTRVTALIRAADSFFIATVTPSGWPYIQHRGGPPGFVHVLNSSTIALADYPGNQQFVTIGNLDANDAVALFFIDYPTRTRVKVYGRAEVVERADDPDLVAGLLTTPGGVFKAGCDRALVVHVEALDRNCTKNIPPKYGEARMGESLTLARKGLQDEIDVLQTRNTELEREISQLRGCGNGQRG
ncbi:MULTISPECIES: pyridoxamine 5'-phosphate oxidase family protein [unclassified Rhodococcus (in: high G+C Gram-positive bacteria)]|uniref:pyridoxamine 5'-phosphate oxidase family protein n=1 Tax=unclassified Rhodococcus (in: high G+C Gram-positive bacteria) TaxID=192944 RepID=UPI001639A0F1|nr:MULTISPECIES: pyridoxamine 5'-phosphate oxidase family protein [unclassified Rhodococcus (in: high G+C Gram-positive bacteria)]MBC2638286.1 pyridoxamine 5'-phosphate oxidase family protein [Rhodococcus sp. 3A]MBC2896973.1 pyridoxamine 5'-phosphate oxidase family protein [Rhodococcus sp. 4CII]